MVRFSVASFFCKHIGSGGTEQQCWLSSQCKHFIIPYAYCLGGGLWYVRLAL